MTGKKSNNGLMVLAALLAVVLIGTIIYTVTLYQDKVKTEETLTQEKGRVLESLNSLQSEYEKAIMESNATNEELVEARDRIAKYIDSVKAMKADIKYLFRYKNQVAVLKRERAALMRKVDSLTQTNTLLTSTIDSTLVEIEKQSVFRDSLIVQNTQLADAVRSGSALSISKINVSGVKVRNSGKMVETARARRIDKIKICFTVNNNKIATAGDRKFYIELLDPQGNVMGEKTPIEVEGKPVLTASKMVGFYYENANLDVCDFVIKPGDGFQKGEYLASIYDDNLEYLISNKFTLK
ncbi:MAG: hypothetical protein OIF50_05105 [Flavobacteriaceae bacterium]|nr:hypothetical protein [Flavobacteriaceae bacterium]